MKVIFQYDAGPKLLAITQSALPEDAHLVLAPEGDRAPLLDEIGNAGAIWHVLQPLTADILCRAPQLKLIQKIGVGVNTIDLDYCRSNNIAVCNMPGTNSRSVAEMTLLLMLSCLRRLPDLDQKLRRGLWNSVGPAGENLEEIAGKRIGLIGFGAIPQILAPILATMGADVIYCNRSATTDQFRRVALEELVTTSDIISLHIPLTPETQKILSADVLSRSKAGVVIINTARGGLIDETALIAGLEAGHIGAAGLDVFDPEPTEAGNLLLQMPNVTVTPHIAWLTRPTWERSIDIACVNVRAILRGQPLMFQVV